MKKWYLLIKQHNKTGLKYLCRHVTRYEKTCFNYPGSGVYWKRHLNKHGDDCSTQILEVCDSEEQSKNRGLYWSDYFDVVDSKDWANLVVENGQGGSGPASYRKTHPGWRGFKLLGDDNPSKRLEVRKKISDALKGRKFTDEWKKNLSEARMGVKPWNKGKPNPTAHIGLAKMNVTVTCPHCKKEGGLGAMKRWHFDRCILKMIDR